jgi:hypothetical protein
MPQYAEPSDPKEDWYENGRRIRLTIEDSDQRIEMDVSKNQDDEFPQLKELRYLSKGGIIRDEYTLRYYGYKGPKNGPDYSFPSRIEITAEGLGHSLEIKYSRIALPSPKAPRK